MDQASIKKNIWKISQEIMKGHKVYVGSGGRPGITHNIYRDDVGIKLVRYAEYGIVNKECVALFHDDYTVAFEREWPNWDADPRDKEGRKLGTLSFYVSGDFHKVSEASIFMQMISS